MVATTWDALRVVRGEFVRKGLEGGIFIWDNSAPLLTALTGADSALQTLPLGHRHLGFLTKDGAQWGGDVSTSDVPAWGETGPVRSDVTGATTTLGFTGIETNRATIELYTGANLEDYVPAVGGEVQIAETDRPSARYWRALSIAVDMADEGEVYIGRYLPRAKITDRSGQNHNDGDDPISWGGTLTGYRDSTAGYAHKWFFGGPGWASMLEGMGFQAAATA